MSRALFENSKAALAFAGMTLVSAAIFVSNEGGAGSLTAALENQREQVKRDAQEFSEKNSSANDEEPVFGEYGAGGPPAEFASDDELIADTAGFDPTPSDDNLVDVYTVTDTPENSSGSRPISRSGPNTGGGLSLSTNRGRRISADDDAQDAAVSRTPVITSRSVTVEPR